MSHPLTRTRTTWIVVLLVALLPLTLPATAAGASSSKASPAPGSPNATPHEVWALDQGTDLIHIYDSRGYDEVARIDVRRETLRNLGFTVPDVGANPDQTVPHMIDFDSKFRYAFVAATNGRMTIVIDVAKREVVEVLSTGAGSHMAAVTPDDSAVWVAAIGARQLVEIALDLDADAPTFEIGRSLDVAKLLDDTDYEWPSFSPVCHQFTPDSKEAWVTLGPGWAQGGLFVLDLETAEVVQAYDPKVVRANCGVGVNPQGTRVIANWSGRVESGNDTNGEYYVFDAHSKELLATRSARGFDAHGVRFTPDGKQLWAVNRITDNALIINANTFEVTREIARIGDSPDILDFSPDGRVVYVTQRGPVPQSGGIHAATGNDPGVAVVDARTTKTIRVLRPPAVHEATGAQRLVNDLHGIGVVPVPRAKPAPPHDFPKRASVPARTANPFGCHVTGAA